MKPKVGDTVYYTESKKKIVEFADLKVGRIDDIEPDGWLTIQACDRNGKPLGSWSSHGPRVVCENFHTILKGQMKRIVKELKEV